MAIVIADAGPLIALAKVDRLAILRGLFGTVRVPGSVWRECLAKSGGDTARIEEAVAVGWLNVVSIDHPVGRGQGLGPGETEAIELASRSSGSLLIVDDRLARRAALERGVRFVGTVRVLLVAEQRGLIEEAESVVSRMAASGYRISVELLRRAREAGSFDGDGA